tara:strand:- start:986 stop:2275 length:1290 start_codon:yes stop_codon:yes gene_type:complete
MTKNNAINLTNLSKEYPVFNSAFEKLKYLLNFIVYNKSRSTKTKVRALSNINLQVRKGERVGIIGRNGAGKSTLIKLLAGNFIPSTGKIETSGDIYSMLPGSVSFLLNQSTRKNAIHHLSYQELKPQEIEKIIEDIEEFTELKEYFDQPFVQLSLGMRVRAEFAVATAKKSDIILIDEVLGAGDLYWSEKIAKRVESIAKNGSTLVFISHNISQINRFCNRVIWIEGGEIVMDDRVNEVTKKYEAFLENISWETDDIDDKTINLRNINIDNSLSKLEVSDQPIIRFPGIREVEIVGFWLNKKNNINYVIFNEDPIEIKISLKSNINKSIILGYRITLFDEKGNRIAAIESEGDKKKLSKNEIFNVFIKRNSLGLQSGTYYISITVENNLLRMTTTNEKVHREDLLYKSFKLIIKDKNNYKSLPYVHLNI